MKKRLLGSNIQQRRKEIGMSQAELAENADISINFLSKLERNKSTKVSSDTLNDLARALNTSMESLVNGPTKVEETSPGPQQAKLIKLLNSYPVKERESLSASIINLLTHQK